MAEYFVQSSNPKTFSLLKNDDLLGTLKYKSWFSLKAAIKLSEKSTYKIAPVGFGGTKLELSCYEKVLYSFKVNWNGSIVIKKHEDKNDTYFALKHQGVFKNSFILHDSNEEDLLHLTPDFKWSKLNYDYKITASPEFEALAQKELLLLISTHCANYYITMMTAAAT